MEPVLEHIALAMGVSFTAFISTSMDNFVLLVTMSLHRKYGAFKVGTGYLLAVIIMIAISLTLAQGVQLLPASYIPYVGLVPLSVGLYELYHLFTRHWNPAISDAAAALPPKSGTLWTVVLVMLTHSWDSIGVLAPLFSDTKPVLALWMVVAVLATGLLLTLCAQLVLAHPPLREKLERLAPKFLPFLLISIGLYILSNTPTDVT